MRRYTADAQLDDIDKRTLGKWLECTRRAWDWTIERQRNAMEMWGREHRPNELVEQAHELRRRHDNDWVCGIPVECLVSKIREANRAWKSGATHAEQVEKGGECSARLPLSRNALEVQASWRRGVVVLPQNVSVVVGKRIPEVIPHSIVIERDELGRHQVTFEVREEKRRTALGSTGVVIGGRQLAVTSDSRFYRWPARRREIATHVHRMREAVSESKDDYATFERHSRGLAKVEEELENAYLEASERASEEIAKQHHTVYMRRGDMEQKCGWEGDLVDEAFGWVATGGWIMKRMDRRWMIQTLEWLEDRSEAHGTRIVVVENDTDLGGTCHACGEPERERNEAKVVWNCRHCGARQQRDANAAMDIASRGEAQEERRVTNERRVADEARVSGW